MISFTRSLSQLADFPSAATRRIALALVSIVTVSLTVLLAAAPAGAFISGKFGLQQRKPVWVRQGPLQYHDGPVIHASDSYAIYWDPDELYNPEWMRLIDKYFQNVGAGSGGFGDVFSVNTQYGETGYSTSPAATASAKAKHAANQSTFRGAYTETESYPVTENCTQEPDDTFPAVACLTDKQIQTMLTKLIKSGKLPGSTGTPPGPESEHTPVYYVLTPPGVTVCTEEGSSPSACSNSTALEEEAKEIKEGTITHRAETGICGYHSWMEPEPKKPVVYAVQPWVAGDAGLFSDSEVSAEVLACQADTSPLEEPNQNGLSFASYGAGLADVLVGDLANEQANIVVDPLLNGWYQDAPLATEKGYPEQGDMCQFNFGPPPETPPVPNPQTHAAALSNEEIGSGAYYLHWAFNSSGLLGKGGAGCWQGIDLEPHITAPNPVNVGDVIGLDAGESDLTLDAAPLGLRQRNEVTRLAEEVKKLGEEEGNLTNEIAHLSAEEANGATSAKVKRADHELKLVDEEDKEIVIADKPLAKEEETLAKEDKLIKEREPFLAPIYKWDFGYQENGKEVTEEGEEKASVFHTFPCAKTYTVELTVVDGGGDEQGLPESKGIKEITVVGGKPCEESPSGGGGGNGAGSGGGSGATPSTTSPGTSTAGSGTSTTTSGAGSSPAKPIPGPVASAAVVSRSLASVLKKGLMVSYSVNEQVAGQFQVLLASSLAKRIGLHGAPATGLAPGSAPSIVIGKAILVTTKGGRNTVKIQFGKKTAAKLRKLGSVPLTIRLIVRNASSHSPLTTTVISTVTLSR